MKTFTVKIIAMIAIMASVVYSDDKSTPSEQEQANQLVDSIVATLKAEPSFDPLVVTNETIRLTHNGTFKLNTDAKLWDTKIYGLSSIAREGDASLAKEGSAFGAKIRLGDNDIKFLSNVKLVDMPKFPELKVEVNVDSIDIILQIGIDNAGIPKMQEFSVENYNNIKVKVHGLSSMADLFVDAFTDAYLSVLKQDAERTLTIVMRPVIENVLKEFKFD